MMYAKAAVLLGLGLKVKRGDAFQEILSNTLKGMLTGSGTEGINVSAVSGVFEFMAKGQFSLPDTADPAVLSNVLPMVSGSEARAEIDAVGSDNILGVNLGDALIPKCSPFPVERFDDGAHLVSDGEPINRYAWGANSYTYSEAPDKVVSVMIHSGGTPAALSGVPSKPTITLRDETAEIIAKVDVEEEFIGLRSALVWKVNLDGNQIESVEILAGNIGGGGAFLYKFTIDLMTMEVEREVLLGTGATHQVPGSSIRSLRRLPADDCADSTNGVDSASSNGSTNERVVFATLDESFQSNTANAKVYIFDPDDPGTAPSELELKNSQLNGGGNPILSNLPRGIWDFEIDYVTKKVYYNVVRINPEFFPGDPPTANPQYNVDRIGGFDIIPEFYVGSLSDVCSPNGVSGATGVGGETQVEEFTDIRTDNLSSASSIQPLPSGNVLYCTLSGFVYQLLAAGALSGGISLPTIGPGLDLGAAELGYPQSCYICDSFDHSCNRHTPPTQNILSAYIWDVEICGSYVFAGTLDLTGLFVELVKGTILDLPDVSLPSPGPLLGLVLDLFVYFLLSVLLQQPIFLTNGGFNLIYANTNDLTTSADPSSEWKTITMDGFNRVRDTDVFGLLGLFGFNEGGFLEYLRGRPLEDGVRNMVCIDNGSEQYLAVGTAVYYDTPSNTYIVGPLTDPEDNNFCPGASFIDFFL